jgi:hypothetical protein
LSRLKRATKTEYSPIPGIRNPEILVRVNSHAGGLKEAFVVGLIPIITRVVDQRSIEVALPNDEVSRVAGPDLPHITKAEDSVVQLIGDVKVGCSRVTINYDPSARGDRESASFDQVGPASVSELLSENPRRC